MPVVKNNFQPPPSSNGTTHIPVGLATLVQATEDLRHHPSNTNHLHNNNNQYNHHHHSTHFLQPPTTSTNTNIVTAPPLTATTTTNIQMMNNLAELPTHHVVHTPPSISIPSIKPPSSIDALCHHCGYDGTDIVIRNCGCVFHARCIPWYSDTSIPMNGITARITSNSSFSSETSDNNIPTTIPSRTLIHSCPGCNSTPCTLVLQPMKFDELDEARKLSLQLQGNKKKKSSSSATASSASEKSGRKRHRGNENSKTPTATYSTMYDPTDDEKLDVSFVLGDMNTTTTTSKASATTRQNNTSHHTKNSGPTPNHAEADCRVGRWSEEETKFCNKLIAHFMAGQFPLLDGTKLNEFLANVLKLKQSRLTKKMKNAALAAKHYARTTGSIPTVQECIDFSAIEQDFLKKLTNPMEAADLKFHMQLFWRESFNNFCIKMHHPLDAREWLTSVEEMERRASYMKDAIRMAKRKLYMGYALDVDKVNPDMGIFIDSDPLTRQNHASSVLENSIDSSDDELDDFVDMIPTDPSSAAPSILPPTDPEMLSKTTAISRVLGRSNNQSLFSDNCNSWHYSSPFLAKVLVIIHRLCLPFEYLEAWVPSEYSGDLTAGCRLYFAGDAITESYVSPTPIGNTSTTTTSTPLETLAIPLSPDDRFNLLCFGDYSEKFSFQIGSGLPGRVYATGVPIWEQNISEGDKTHFERCGAAKLFGIRTALGIPVPSPTVGRIILVLYSQYDRPRDNTMVINLVDAVVKLLPSPRWKLCIDVGKDTSTSHSRAARTKRSAASIRKDSARDNRLSSNTTARPTPSTSAKSQASSDKFQNVAETSVSIPDKSSRQKKSAAHSNPHSNLKVDSDRSSGNITSLKEELISILGEHMPLDTSSDFAFCLPGFMSLRLLLLKSNITAEEEEMITTILNSFASFRSTRLSNGEIAVMLTRDFLYLKQIQSRVEQQNSVASVLHQWSNNHVQQPGGSLVHPPFEGNNVSFSIPNISNFSMPMGGILSSDHPLHQSFDSLHSDSDHINPSQHPFSNGDVRFPSFR